MAPQPSRRRRPRGTTCADDPVMEVLCNQMIVHDLFVVSKGEATSRTCGWLLGRDVGMLSACSKQLRVALAHLALSVCGVEVIHKMPSSLMLAALARGLYDVQPGMSARRASPLMRRMLFNSKTVFKMTLEICLTTTLELVRKEKDLLARRSASMLVSMRLMTTTYRTFLITLTLYTYHVAIHSWLQQSYLDEARHLIDIVNSGDSNMQAAYAEERLLPMYKAHAFQTKCVRMSGRLLAATR